MLDLFQGSITLQSVDLSLFFLPSFTSEASPQVVAYFTVAMATAHGKQAEKEEEKNTTTFTYL